MHLRVVQQHEVVRAGQVDDVVGLELEDALGRRAAVADEAVAAPGGEQPLRGVAERRGDDAVARAGQRRDLRAGPGGAGVGVEVAPVLLAQPAVAEVLDADAARRRLVEAEMDRVRLLRRGAVVGECGGARAPGRVR